MAKSRMFIRPRAGRLLRDYDTMARVPDDGAWKPADSRWHRRLRGGDDADGELGTPPKTDPPKDGDLYLQKTKKPRS